MTHCQLNLNNLSLFLSLRHIHKLHGHIHNTHTYYTYTHRHIHTTCTHTYTAHTYTDTYIHSTYIHSTYIHRHIHTKCTHTYTAHTYTDTYIPDTRTYQVHVHIHVHILIMEHDRLCICNKLTQTPPQNIPTRLSHPQCDQLSRLFIRNSALYNNKNFPNNKVGSKYCQTLKEPRLFCPRH